MLRNFEDLVKYLEQEVDWNSPNYQGQQKVENVLKEVLDNTSIIQHRIEEIYSDATLLSFFQPHIEFRPLMDKFPIYFDSEDRFRIRVNHFKSKLLNKGARPETPHNHRFPFSTIILSGSYKQCTYTENEVNEVENTAQLSLINCQTYSVGDSYSLTTETIHNVFNESQEEPCISLFVRGRAFSEYSTVYQPEVGKFFRSYGLKKELKRELSLINQYISSAERIKN